MDTGSPENPSEDKKDLPRMQTHPISIRVLPRSRSQRRLRCLLQGMQSPHAKRICREMGTAADITSTDHNDEDMQPLPSHVTYHAILSVQTNQNRVQRLLYLMRKQTITTIHATMERTANYYFERKTMQGM